MYKGLVKNGNGRPKISTRQQKYGLQDKTHSVVISGMGTEEYYGPPRPGQSFAQYESFMSMPITSAGAAIVGALLFGPIGLVAGGIGGWLAGSKTKIKSQTQGG